MLLDRGVAASMASTAAFVVLVTANAVLILASRSARTTWRSLFEGLSAVGRWVLAGTLAALTDITVVPFLVQPFRLVPLPPGYWLASLLVGLSLVLLFQLTKRVLTMHGSQATPAPGN